MSFTGEGIYRITNASVPSRIDLAGGSDTKGTLVRGWGATEDFNQMWLIKAVAGQPDTFTVCNVVSGTYMDLSEGSSKDATPILGWTRTTGDNQLWIIKSAKSGSDSWKIQNKASKTFVDLANGGSANGTKIECWSGTWDDTNDHQRWVFDSQSLSAGEVQKALNKNPYLGKQFKSYISDGLYLILSQARLQDIWRGSGLQNRCWREEIFDCDDFAFAYKVEVSKWGDDHFKANGFAILAGVVFGSNARGAHAYNWVIKSADHGTVEFFEPQNNTFMDNPGYSAYFGVF